MSDAPIASPQPLLSARGVTKDYFDGTRVLRVLSDASLDIFPGESVSIVGASGAGKSTLLHLLGALDKPTSGSIKLKGEELAAMDSRGLAAVRNRSVGFIFQFHHLLGGFNALENVMMPGLILGQDPDEMRKKATDLLSRIGLGDRLTHRPSKLSGGEQQRVSLARALANDPDLILADEPSGNLDAGTAKTVMDLLWENTVGRNKSLVIVTHDPEIAAKAGRPLRLRDGGLHVE